MNNKKKIEDALYDLMINDDREFVTMLSGEWGIGKTHFWNDFREKYLDTNQKEIAYVSLFGQNSLEDIETSIVLQVSSFTQKLQGISKRIKEIKAKILKGEDISIPVPVNAILSLLSNKDFENVVICFDDFERLSDKISLKDVMGLISLFKEQKRCKVMMILNEDELHNRTDKDGQRYNEIFGLYKEKILDYSFHYNPSQEELFKTVEKDMSVIKFCKHESIYNFFTKVELRNIRIMKQVIYQLNQFSFISKYKLDDEVIEEFVQIVINISLFIAQTNLSYEEFVEIKAHKSFPTRDIQEKTKYDNYLALYNETVYSITRDEIERHIYQFIENYAIDKDALEELLRLNGDNQFKNKIKNNFDKLKYEIDFDFNSTLKSSTNKVFDLIKTKRDNIPYILDINEFHYFVNFINTHNKLSTKRVVDDTIKRYIDVGIISKNFLSSCGQNKMFIEEHYPHLLKYLDDKKEEYLKENITIVKLEKLLGDIISVDWRVEDTHILNNISSKTYQDYISRSSKFYFNITNFLATHKDTQRFAVSIESIKEALRELKTKSDEYKWKIEQMQSSIELSLED